MSAAMIATCGASALFLAALVLGMAQHAMAQRETLEQESERTREVAAHGAHWNGICVESDLDAEIPFALDTVEDKDDWLRRHLHKNDAA